MYIYKIHKQLLRISPYFTCQSATKMSSTMYRHFVSNEHLTNDKLF